MSRGVIQKIILGSAVALTAMAMSSLATVQAEESDEDILDSERFQLFDECAPMWLFVTDLNSDASEIGLTKEAIEVAAESRLRSARLYTSEVVTRNGLGIEVGVVGSAFLVSLDYIKLTCDPRLDICIHSATWQAGSFGTHTGDASFVLSAVSQHMDKFLAEYLRVNEDECS